MESRKRKIVPEDEQTVVACPQLTSTAATTNFFPVAPSSNTFVMFDKKSIKDIIQDHMFDMKAIKAVIKNKKTRNCKQAAKKLGLELPALIGFFRRNNTSYTLIKLEDVTDAEFAAIFKKDMSLANAATKLGVPPGMLSEYLSYERHLDYLFSRNTPRN